MTSPDLYGNPSIIYQNPNFPFNLRASQVLDRVPGSLVASPQVLAQFLKPPEFRGDWFCYQAWDKAALVLRFDDAVTPDEFTSAISKVKEILDELIGWTRDRPAMPDGYAEQLPDGMLQVGSQALRDISSLPGRSRHCMTDPTSRTIRRRR